MWNLLYLVYFSSSFSYFTSWSRVDSFGSSLKIKSSLSNVYPSQIINTFLSRLVHSSILMTISANSVRKRIYLITRHHLRIQLIQKSITSWVQQQFIFYIGWRFPIASFTVIYFYVYVLCKLDKIILKSLIVKYNYILRD